MEKNMRPSCWEDVYASAEEQKFFITLTRHKKFDKWVSISILAKETKLPREIIERIVEKYYNKGMVFQRPHMEEQWGYWENVPEMLPGKYFSVAEKDRLKRLYKCLHPSDE